MRRPVSGSPAAPFAPRVADQAVHDVEVAGVQFLAHAKIGPADDHLQLTGVARRLPDLLQPRLELRHRQVPYHGCHQRNYHPTRITHSQVQVHFSHRAAHRVITPGVQSPELAS
jgi:hypothetical protein